VPEEKAPVIEQLDTVHGPEGSPGNREAQVVDYLIRKAKGEKLDPPPGYTITGRKKWKRQPAPRGPYVRHVKTRVIPDEKMQEMFTVYCNMPNYAYVARVTGVHMATVRKYAVSQAWEERREKILLAARDKTDYTVEKATTQSLEMLQTLKQKIRDKIDTLTTDDLSTDTLVADFERLVKLEQVLLGGVGDRREVVSTHEERIKSLRVSRGMRELPKTVEGELVQ